MTSASELGSKNVVIIKLIKVAKVVSKISDQKQMSLVMNSS